MTRRCPHVSDHLREGWRILLRHPPFNAATPEDQASALMSLLLNLMVDELQRTDHDAHSAIRASMRTLADRLQTLAATPAAQLEPVAQFLSDDPRAGLTRQ